MDVCWGGTGCTTEEFGTGGAIALAVAEGREGTDEYPGVDAGGGGGYACSDELALEETAEGRVDTGGGGGGYA